MVRLEDYRKNDGPAQIIQKFARRFANFFIFFSVMMLRFDIVGPLESCPLLCYRIEHANHSLMPNNSSSGLTPMSNIKTWSECKRWKRWRSLTRNVV
jgi:hypothetical protein